MNRQARRAMKRGRSDGPGQVDLSPLHRLVDNMENGDGSEHDRLRQFNSDVPGTLVTLRRRHHRQMGLLPVPINGSVPAGMRAGYYAMRLRDGSLGYVQRRADDCFQAAIASCLQIPMHQVPDVQINRQLDAGKEPEEINRQVDETMSRWLAGQGVQLTLHSGRLPTAGRWIGVVRGPEREEFANDHCLVMQGRDCLLETSKPYGDLDLAVHFGYEDVDYGITIE